MSNKSQRFEATVAASDLTPSATRIGWRILITVVLLLLVAVLSILLQGKRGASAAPLMQSTGDPLVMALYYPWFDEATWTY
ncbi:MAG: hypothetical protein IPK16_25320, partial [Anaerolineales bacterium]|nr:hypothetical protein [Anaerolineales bacterium]